MTPVPTVPSPITPTLILAIYSPQLYLQLPFERQGERSRTARRCATDSILTSVPRVPRMDNHSTEKGLMVKGNRISKVTTRTGDSGETALVGGERVSKASRRVDADGEVDELNSLLGWVRAQSNDAEIDEV